MQTVKHSAMALFLAVISFTTSAHPHSFISLKTELVTDGTQLSGLKMRWTMDEITSADLLYDAGNAKPGDEIWKKLAAEVMANVLGQHYFTEFWHNGQKVKFLNRPTEYGMSRDGHQAVLTFVLPLAHPQPLAGQNILFPLLTPPTTSTCTTPTRAMYSFRPRCRKPAKWRFTPRSPAKRR